MDMAVLLRLPAIPFPLKHSLHSTTRIRMALKSQKNKNTQVSFPSTTQNLPILLFDIMDTIVRDPFYHDVPAFFRMSFEELIESKHPTAWIEFEKGMIDEVELARKFFKDGRPLDLEGLKNCMKEGYSYIEGVEELLQVLKHNNYQMHAFTNYPIWYEMIEDKLNISKYLSWTFCSCINGKRKPDPEFFLEVVRDLQVDPASCIFVDDRFASFVYFEQRIPNYDAIYLGLRIYVDQDHDSHLIRRNEHHKAPSRNMNEIQFETEFTVNNAASWLHPRMRNVEAAKEVGIVGLHFKNVDLLRQDLSLMGIVISIDQTNLAQE